MKKLTAALLIGAIALWAGLAFAQGYTGLPDSPNNGVKLGVGGLIITGDDGNGDSQSDFIPTVNLAG